jgi:hypothetical protein
MYGTQPQLRESQFWRKSKLLKNTPNAAIYLLAIIFCATGVHSINKNVRTKVAEGSYVKKSPSLEKLDRWVLWRKPDRTYQLSSLLFPDSTISDGSTLEQLTDFDPALKMQGFVLKGRDKEKSGTLSCELRFKRLTCRADVGGKTSSGSTAVEGPYIVAPIPQGEFNGVPWLLAPMLRLATRNAATVTYVLYIIVWPDEDFEFEPIMSLEIRYVGKETIAVAGHKVTAHRYEEVTERATIWTAENGIVLAYEMLGKDGFRVELADFKQYEDFLPELK